MCLRSTAPCHIEMTLCERIQKLLMAQVQNISLIRFFITCSIESSVIRSSNEQFFHKILIVMFVRWNLPIYSLSLYLFLLSSFGRFRSTSWRNIRQVADTKSFKTYHSSYHHNFTSKMKKNDIETYELRTMCEICAASNHGLYPYRFVAKFFFHIITLLPLEISSHYNSFQHFADFVPSSC